MEHAILDVLPAHIALLDSKGVIVAVNAAWRRFASDNQLQSEDAGVGQSYLEICEFARGKWSERADIVADGIRAVLSGATPEFRVDYPCHAPNLERWFRLHITPDPGTGGAVVVHVDITRPPMDSIEVQRATQRADESERRLGFALDAAGIGDWDLDLRSNIARRSLRHDQCFGYEQPIASWGYDTFLRHVHLDDRARVDGVFQQALRGDGEFEAEFRTVWPDGSEHWLWVRGRFYRHADGVAYRVAGVVADISERMHNEQQLLGSRASLVASQRIAHLGSWELNLTGWPSLGANALRWSDEVFRIWGYEPGSVEVSYANFLAAVHPGDRVQIEAAFGAALRELRPYDLTHRIVRPDGSERVVREQAEIQINEETGRPHRLVGTVLDITELHESEHALRESEQRLDLATRSAGIGIWDWSVREGSLLWDARMYELYGLDPLEAPITTERWQQTVHPDDWEPMAARVQQTIDDDHPYNNTFRIVLPGGDIRHLQAYAVLKRFADGTPDRMIGVNWDITARKREENALSQLAAIVASSDDAIIGKDLKSVVTSWNGGAERIFGYTAAEMIGTSIVRLFPEDRVHEEARIIERVTAGQNVEHFETVRRTKDGRLIEVSVTSSPIRDAAGHVIGVSKVARDISERKKLERQFYRAQRLESIGTLAGGIAHDLNNALSPIILSLDLLNAAATDQSTRELIEVLRTSAEHGADMVRQVLSFARGIDGQRLEVDVRLLVSDVHRIIHDTFLKHVTVTVRRPDYLPPVLGDRTQLQQVLVNLCVNARDAMPTGGRLTIIADALHLDETDQIGRQSVVAGTYVRIRVEDSGEGMSADILERIFDPFFTTKEIGKGTGLGLSTSLAIVESHRGFMRVYSEPGRGTTFSVYLPANTDGAAVNTSEHVPAPRGHGELILVVDDEASVRQLTRRVLENAGYRVLLAADGRDALRQVTNHHAEIAAVLTDMMMPEMDGPSLIRSLHLQHPTLRIIGTSGLTMHDDDEESELHGLAAFVPKPTSANALLQTLHNVLAAPS